MATESPISPPPSSIPPPSSTSTTNTSATATTPASADHNQQQQPPISPISRTTTFPHKTSPAVATQTPLIDTSTPAINAAPVELDGVGMTVEEMEIKRRGTGDSVGSSTGGGEGGVGGTRGVGGVRDAAGGSGVLSPADEEDIDGEFLGDGLKGGVGNGVREKRAAMLASRSKDPGVIVDVPQDPTAEEVEAAKSADGTVTPGLPPTPGLDGR